MHSKETNESELHIQCATQKKSVDQSIMEVVVTMTDERKLMFISALQQLIAAQESSLCDRQKPAGEAP